METRQFKWSNIGLQSALFVIWRKWMVKIACQCPWTLQFSTTIVRLSKLMEFIWVGRLGHGKNKHSFNALIAFLSFLLSLTSSTYSLWAQRVIVASDHTQRLTHTHTHTYTHTQTHHSWQDSSGRVITPTQRSVPDNTQHSQETNIHAVSRIRTHNSSKRAAADPRLRPRGYRFGLKSTYKYTLLETFVRFVHPCFILYTDEGHKVT